MPKDIFDETGKKIGIDNRDDFEDDLIRKYLKNYPDMIELIEPLFAERRNRDLANTHLKHTKADDLTQRVKITEELKEKTQAFGIGYMLLDKEKRDLVRTCEPPKEITAADYRTWILNGADYKEKENLIEDERERQLVISQTAMVLLIMEKGKISLHDKFGNPPPYGD